MTILEKTLYDISINKISENEIENAFDEIADILLRKTLLIAGEKKYLIKELEFYFSSKYYNHIDPYVHTNQYKTVLRQGEFGEWYFHRFNTPETYIKQKFRGLDICFGNKELENFGGILIRQISLIDESNQIEGISNVVGEIIKQIGFENLNLMAKENGNYVFNKNAALHLEEYENTLNKPIYKSTRINLKNNSEEDNTFQLKMYRYYNNLSIKLVRS